MGHPVTIEPYRRRPVPRDVAVLQRSGKVTLETGARVQVCNVPARTTIYVSSWVAEDLAREERRGRLLAYNDRYIRYEIDDRIAHLEDPADLGALATLRDFARDKGAAGTSFASIAGSLLRASLDRPIYTWGGPDPVPLGEVMGGRQHVERKGLHRMGVVQLDMSAAYARRLGELRYGGWWVRFSPDELGDFGRETFHHARVWVPATLANGPLSVRHKAPHPIHPALARGGGWGAERHYPRGDIQGVWSGVELRAAQDAGCGIRLIDSWICAGHDRTPFARWWSWISEARALDGTAGEYGKAIGNTLVGSFMANRSVRCWIDFAGGGMTKTYLKAQPTPPRHRRPWDVAELVTSAIRARLYTDVMLGFADRLIGTHTDGAWLTGSEIDPPAGWRVKIRGPGMVYLGPAQYAYRVENGPLVYVFSGVRERDVPRAISDAARHAGLGPRWRSRIPNTVPEPRQLELQV